jgi:hypothetical protein
MILRIFKRKNRVGVGNGQELGTQSNQDLTLGVVRNGDLRAYNGRVACLRIYNTAFTDKEVKTFSENWECPNEPGKNMVVY